MYGYENAMELTPATEGIKEFGATIWTAIQNFGKRIREIMANIVAKIKNLGKKKGGTSDGASGASSADVSAKTKIHNIGASISTLITDCAKSVNALKNAYEKEGVGTKKYGVTGGMKAVNTEKSIEADAKKNNRSNIDTIYRKENLKSYTDTLKVNFGATFKDYGEKAAEIKNDLSSLAKNAASIDIDGLKYGYMEFKGIFGANGKFAEQWKDVVLAHDWADGDIKSYLGKVVKMYQTGINATNTFGRLLTNLKIKSVFDHGVNGGDMRSEKVSNSNGKFIGEEKEITAKDVRDEREAGEESVAMHVLDKIYQAAYEDARADIARENEMLAIYDSIPDAFA